MNSMIRIIGGSNANFNSAPFIVSLQRGTYDTVGISVDKHGCSGSIITKTVILTAAHCLKTNNLTDIYAIAGLYQLQSNDSNNINSNYYNKLEIVNNTVICDSTCNIQTNDDDMMQLMMGMVQKKRVKFYIRHENFTAWNQSGPNDIALLFLDSGFELNRNIAIIKLINYHDQTKLSALATLYGWGSIQMYAGSKKNRSNVLQMIRTNVLTYEQCQQLIPNNKRLHTTNLCTAGFNQPSIACHGDSGGPLVQQQFIDGRNTVVQIGIVSWGFRICGWKSKPSIYTFVGAYYDWIWRTVREYSD